ncbi:MAG: hypothetical protein AAF922_21130 [Pseudomonadota bacterium]
MSIQELLHRFFRPAAALISLVLLAACAEPTAYAPVGRDGQGYTTQPVEQGRFLVSFRGNSLTDRETVETYLLYRAAEVARDTGGSWFRVSGQNTETVTRFSGTSSGFSSSSFRTFGYGSTSAFGTDFVDVRPIRSFEAFANVQVFRGQKPATDPNAYSVQSVLKTLGPRIRRPAPETS